MDVLGPKVVSCPQTRYRQGMPFRFFAAMGLLAFLANFAWAATYTVVADPSSREAVVAVEIDGVPSEEFRMPAWAPGDYRIVNFGSRLSNVKFFLNGEEVQAETGADPNSWTIAAGADRVTYRVASRTSIFTEDLRVSANEMFFNGPAVLGWFSGRQNEKHTLRVALAPVGAVAYCALDPVDSPDPEFAMYTAPDYDTLIDAPVVVGTAIRAKEFTVHGKPHYIVAFNRASSFDLDPWASAATRVIQETARIFGELPYKRYMFLFDIGGPGGGLEHASSTRMALRTNATVQSSIEFLAHEFVHTYNVKRIRPKPFAPYDYTKPAITGALWWLEGVTDYYARIICVRAGLKGRAETLNSFGRDIFLLSQQSRRFQVSADESSRRAWEANNSAGFGIDYYLKGGLIGLMLDLAIRSETKGERSLDDVMLALYSESKDGRVGFSETRIRELCVLFGGSALGEIYDEAVLRAVEMPWQSVLPRFGLSYDRGRLQDDSFANPDAMMLAQGWPYRTP